MATLKNLVSAVVVLFILVVSALFVYLGSKDQLGGELLLPLLAIAGIVCLLLTLILAAIVFAKVGLADKTQALALPEGSVRAVIALGLLVIFAIVSVYLYGSLAEQGGKADVKMLTVQTQAEVDTLKERAGQTDSNFEIVLVVPEQSTGTEPPHATGTESPHATGTESPQGSESPDKKIGKKQQPKEPSGPYQVYYRTRANRDAADFAKQLLTLIGTLVTAVASFYFGTRAVASAHDAKSDLSPAITSVSPGTIAKVAAGNPTVTSHLTLLGSGLDRVNDVKLSQAGSKPVVGKVETANACAVVCSFQIDSTMQGGEWDLEVSSSSGEKAKRSITIT